MPNVTPILTNTRCFNFSVIVLFVFLSFLQLNLLLRGSLLAKHLPVDLLGLTNGICVPIVLKEILF